MSNFNNLSQSDKIYYANQFINQDYNGFFDLYDIDPKRVKKSGLELAEYLQKYEPKIFRNIVEEAVEQEENVLLGCKRKHNKKNNTMKKTRKTLRGIKGSKNNAKKSDIVEYMSSKSGISKATASKALDYAIEAIRTLSQVDSTSCVTIANFGTFKPSKRRYRNPKTGKMVVSNKVKFTPSKNF